MTETAIFCNAQINLLRMAKPEGVSFRSAHLDAHNNLFAGLFHLRIPEDDSVGGDLVGSSRSKA